MRIERGLVTDDLGTVGAMAAEIEAEGLDGAFSFDGPHDPFLPLVTAGASTQRIRLSTQIAVAFARNPMTVAQTAQDLHRLTDGRFALGLGSQIRAHITRRFSMPWSEPAARMREFIRAVRAIWSTWATDEPLDFRGRFYEHTLMTPFFDPGPNPHGDPPILLAGVGQGMVSVAGEVADGLLVHPFHTETSVREHTLKALGDGLETAGRRRDDVEVVIQTIVALGRDAQSLAEARRGVKAQLGFYGSTPAYRHVLAHHGYEDLQPRLRELTRQDRWGELIELVPDELVDLVAVCGDPETVGRRLRARNGEFADATALVLYDHAGEGAVEELVDSLRGG